jgi:hypothetical protein
MGMNSGQPRLDVVLLDGQQVFEAYRIEGDGIALIDQIVGEQIVRPIFDTI